MFRSRSGSSSRGSPSPHARGDVPSGAVCNAVARAFSPRPWGCSVAGLEAEPPRPLLPTPVGMFREEAAGHGAPGPSPHARGDVPATESRSAIERFFSPRPWGCSCGSAASRSTAELLPTPVGMFRSHRRAAEAPRPSPHARGDVPVERAKVESSNDFSPRPWGCSDERAVCEDGGRLLPTPVGMFRFDTRVLRPPDPSPHARGDVPSPTSSNSPRGSFSPRPWGCSAAFVESRANGHLLPTPVGMFRSVKCSASPPKPSPHARGDVPSSPNALRLFQAFSPRPWGCSAGLETGRARRALLPTPVGMFRLHGRNRRRRHASPHARGDVPRSSASVLPAMPFSPRPWGCSGRRHETGAQSHLLPTPVGMFRSVPSARGAAGASPHARGDVPAKGMLLASQSAFSPRPWGCSDIREPPHDQ